MSCYESAPQAEISLSINGRCLIKCLNLNLLGTVELTGENGIFCNLRDKVDESFKKGK